MIKVLANIYPAHKCWKSSKEQEQSKTAFAKEYEGFLKQKIDASAKCIKK